MIGLHGRMVVKQREAVLQDQKHLGVKALAPNDVPVLQLDNATVRNAKHIQERIL